MSDPGLSPLEVLASELGASAARIERELHQRLSAETEKQTADLRATLAELRAALAEEKLRAMQAERERDAALAERLAAVRDGADGASVTLDDVAPVIAAEVVKAVSAIPAPRDGADGRDADPEVTKAMVADAIEAIMPRLAEMIGRSVADAVAALPAPKPGRDADPAVIRAMVDEAVAALPPAPAGPKGKDGEPGKDGRLPTVKAWSDAVHYEGAVVTHDGATWQAQRDTGRAPPHEDWICLAAPGRNGADGRSFTIRGTWAEGEEYRALDVAVRDGSGYVARTDNPGPCPGEGWQLLASKGKRGGEGQQGPKGDPGRAGPAVVALEVDGEGLMTLRHADGAAVRCDLYPLLSKLG